MFDHLRRQSAEASAEGRVAVLDRLQFLNPAGSAKADDQAGFMQDAGMQHGEALSTLLGALQKGGEEEVAGGQVNRFAHVRMGSVIMDVSYRPP
jgi:hypothetical protein